MSDVAIERGFEPTLYINAGTYAEPTWTELGLARDLEELADPDQMDASVRKTVRVGFKASEVGARDVGWRAPCLKPAAGAADTAFDAVRTAFKARTVIDLLHVEGGLISVDGLDATRAICKAYGGTIAEPLGDVSVIDFEFRFALQSDQSVPQYGTTLDSAFVAAS